MAQTVCDAGLQPWSASATAQCQGWIAELADAGVFSARTDSSFARNEWRCEADRLLAMTSNKEH